MAVSKAEMKAVHWAVRMVAWKGVMKVAYLAVVMVEN